MAEAKIHILKNGITLVHKEVFTTKVAHCGFILDIGSRDENDKQLGLAHFWEHMAFKGTEKRKSTAILNRLEDVGGDLNAFTTKEKIFFYASVLDKHYERALELLTDITFKTNFPIKELEKEKGVILEEISMYEDAPDEAIFDEFDNVLFKNHSLGANILGTPESVKSFTREDFLNFKNENFDTERVVFASVSNMPFAKVVKLAEKHLSDIAHVKTSKKRVAPLVEPFTQIEKVKSISQAHCMLGTYAYPYTNNKRLPFFLLNYLLGGPGMTSRLNMRIREKFGYVYNIETNMSSYVDTGSFSVYFGSEKKYLNKIRYLVFDEFRKVKEKPLSTMQLHRLKEQLYGQLAMSEESNQGLMQSMGKSLLDLGRIDSITDTFYKIEAITAQDIQEVANEILHSDRFSMLTYMPE